MKIHDFLARVSKALLLKRFLVKDMHRKKVSIIKEECFRYTVSKRPLWQKPLIFARRFFLSSTSMAFIASSSKASFFSFFVLNYTSFLLCIQLQNFPGSASTATTHWGKINFLSINSISIWLKSYKIVATLSFHQNRIFGRYCFCHSVCYYLFCLLRVEVSFSGQFPLGKCKLNFR